uniref:Putative secreted protein n=1 Tax=Anopheles darlingi TaxID=43151 RepID=A0A2M4DGK2_ANODA
MVFSTGKPLLILHVILIHSVVFVTTGCILIRPHRSRDSTLLLCDHLIGVGHWWWVRRRRWLCHFGN